MILAAGLAEAGYEGNETGPRQDAASLSQVYCRLPEDDSVSMLPARGPISPDPDGSAPGGNPTFVPLDVSQRGHRRSCVQDGDWVAYSVNLQARREAAGMAWTEQQRLSMASMRYDHAVPGYLPWNARRRR